MVGPGSPGHDPSDPLRDRWPGVGPVASSPSRRSDRSPARPERNGDAQRVPFPRNLRRRRSGSGHGAAAFGRVISAVISVASFTLAAGVVMAMRSRLSGAGSPVNRRDRRHPQRGYETPVWWRSAGIPRIIGTRPLSKRHRSQVLRRVAVASALLIVAITALWPIWRYAF